MYRVILRSKVLWTIKNTHRDPALRGTSAVGLTDVKLL